MEEQNKEKNLMTIIDQDGTEEVEVIIAFKFKDTNKEYIIYTKNERDDKGLITVYISNVDRSSGSTKLYGVDDENEWNRIKDVLRELSKSEQ